MYDCDDLSHHTFVLALATLFTVLLATRRGSAAEIFGIAGIEANGF